MPLPRAYTSRNQTKNRGRAMQWLIDGLSAFLGFLCKIFGVTPKEIEDERQRNPSTRPEA